MFTKTTKTVLASIALFTVLFACNQGNDKSANDANSDISATRNREKDDQVKHGQYLATIGQCNDCHSPKTMTPRGPVIDSSKLLSGHDAAVQFPPLSADDFKPGPWGRMALDGTAFAGPWGVSYPANLTPDSATGIGAWTEEVFVKTLRTGKHLGQENGREILPPMPWPNIAQMTDDDLSALFAYLRSIPPVSNRVPAPLPPTAK
jgi:mono/diheme cytochrome c family protein